MHTDASGHLVPVTPVVATLMFRSALGWLPGYLSSQCFAPFALVVALLFLSFSPWRTQFHVLAFALEPRLSCAEREYVWGAGHRPARRPTFPVSRIRFVARLAHVGAPARATRSQHEQRREAMCESIAASQAIDLTRDKCTWPVRIAHEGAPRRGAGQGRDCGMDVCRGVSSGGREEGRGRRRWRGTGDTEGGRRWERVRGERDVHGGGKEEGEGRG